MNEKIRKHLEDSETILGPACPRCGFPSYLMARGHNAGRTNYHYKCKYSHTFIETDIERSADHGSQVPRNQNPRGFDSQG